MIHPDTVSGASPRAIFVRDFRERYGAQLRQQFEQEQNINNSHTATVETTNDDNDADQKWQEKYRDYEKGAIDAAWKQITSEVREYLRIEREKDRKSKLVEYARQGVLIMTPNLSRELGLDSNTSTTRSGDTHQSSPDTGDELEPVVSTEVKNVVLAKEEYF